MLKRIKQHLFEEIKDTSTGGAPEPKQSAAPEVKANPETVQKAGETTVDDYGYEVVKESAKGAEDKAPAEGKKSEQQNAKADDEISGPVGGYGKDEIKVEEEVSQPETKKTEETVKDDLGYELKTEGLDESEAKKIIDIVKAHKLPKEAAEALLEMKKSEIKAAAQTTEAAKKEYQKQILLQKASWDKELRNDATFGGENFLHSLKKVDKVLGDYFTSTKKVLTERGSTLPPYVMQDLAKLAEHLYSPGKFVQGGANSADTNQDNGKENNHLDFYNT